MSTVKIRTNQNVYVTYRVADPLDRVLAFLTDLFIVLGLLYIINLSYEKLVPEQYSSGWFFWLVWLFRLFPLFFYHLLSEFIFNGRSVGKIFFKMGVISLDGNRPRLAQYLIRWAFKLIDMLLVFPGGVALLMIVTQGRGQRLGDLLANTAVVSTAKSVDAKLALYIREYAESYQPQFLSATLLSDKDVRTVETLLRVNYRLKDANATWNAARRVAEVMQIAPPEEKPLNFLDQVVKDYRYMTSQ